MAPKPIEHENRLLVEIAGGDQRAFTEIFDFYQRYVYLYGKKLTRSDDLAGEIVQDVFLKIWIGREKLSEIESFGAYLNRVVRNHSLNVIRKLAQDAKSTHELKVHARESDESTTELLDYNDSNRILNQAIENLPPQQRMVYTLCHVEGMKYEEAAAKLNISSRTVQAHMGQALKNIREHFKKNALAYPILFSVLFK
ncbi:RNA polymerase sigma-70 factor [Pedobacter nutrimenti]|uniref:RNA polymerase sigma-70 factor n=1 Tax=Pedobacter nutrimenti TaxID=1241337 RepID=UPI002931F06F|nr:RNA polymerase sigma-70 factor [Pedobacter nutrimenti]